MLWLLLLLRPLLYVGGEGARRDIDIEFQAADAPLFGSVLGLGNVPYRTGSNTNQTALARVVGVTQVDSDFAVRAWTTALIVPTTTRAVLTGACPPGQFNADAYTCTTCPWGFWCPAGGASAVACALGTANPVAGATEASACVRCAAGTYTPSVGAYLCLACPPGDYCAGGASPPTACPAHTSSSAGASSLLDCACDADYACTYARSVTLSLKLNTNLSVQELQSDSGIARTLNDAFLMAMGLYGAPGVKAVFKGFVTAPP